MTDTVKRVRPLCLISGVMKMPSCRSSGLLTADTQVVTGSCKLISIHVCNDGGAPFTCKVFDGTDNTGKEVARFTVQPEVTVEYDMHGVLMTNGIFYEETTSNGSVFINFA